MWSAGSHTQARADCLARGDQWDMINNVCDPSFANLKKECESSGKNWAVVQAAVNHECLTDAELNPPITQTGGDSSPADGREIGDPGNPPPSSGCAEGEELVAGKCLPECAPGQIRGETGGCTSPPSGAEVAAELRGQLPQMRTPEFRPPSVGDILTDPRYRAAAREQDRAIRAQAAASGVTGAPLITATEDARQGLLGEMMDTLYGQDLGSWGANLQRDQAEFGRAWAPTQFGYQHSLGQAGLGLQGQQAGWNRQNQLFNQWWLPEQQQRLFGQQKWLTGQENLMNLMMFQLGLSPAGLQQRSVA